MRHHAHTVQFAHWALISVFINLLIPIGALLVTVSALLITLKLDLAEERKRLITPI
jgi:hypothetical protein